MSRKKRVGVIVLSILAVVVLLSAIHDVLNPRPPAGPDPRNAFAQHAIDWADVACIFLILIASLSRLFSGMDDPRHIRMRRNALALSISVLIMGFCILPFCFQNFTSPWPLMLIVVLLWAGSDLLLQRYWQ